MANLLVQVTSGAAIFALAAFVTGFIAGAWLREVACGAALGRMDGRHARMRGRLRQCRDDLHACRMPAQEKPEE